MADEKTPDEMRDESAKLADKADKQEAADTAKADAKDKQKEADEA